jgi:hypothetical protein
MLAVSRDGGETWETRLQPDGTTVIQDSLNVVGIPGVGILDQARVAIGPQGDIYITNYGGGDFTVHHSTDAGASFDGPDHVTGRRIAFGTTETTMVNGVGLVSNHFRTNPLRDIVADPTRPGHVYVADTMVITDPLGNQIDAADVIFARSSDYGVTWQTTFKIGLTDARVLNDDNGGQSATGLTADEVISGQAMPRMTVDAQGNIALIWYDTRHDPANHLLDVFGTVSTDGGQTFSPNFRVTNQSFDANAGKFTDATGNDNFYLGDFIGLAAADNTVYAAWTDTRNNQPGSTGRQDIFFARYPLAPAPLPPNDRFEPNNTPQTATDLGRVIKRVLPRLALPPGDEDWFRLEAASTGDLTVSATQSLPGRNLRLELLDSGGVKLLATGSDILDQNAAVVGQVIRFPASSGKTYLVHVLPGANAGSGSYSLQLQSLTADLGTVVHSAASGLLAAGEEAYTLLTAAAAGSLEVQLTPGADVQGGFRLELIDPNTLSVLASANPNTLSVLASARGPASRWRCSIRPATCSARESASG